MKIKEWAEEDRPREKMLLKGIASLSDAELLAILIGSGNSRETAVQLSQRILNSVNNNLNALGKLSVKELMSKFKGIGKVKAITIGKMYIIRWKMASWNWWGCIRISIGEL